MKDFEYLDEQRCLGMKNFLSNQRRMLAEEKTDNILVASFVDDLGYQQKDFDDRVLFYNSETLLEKQSLLDHFSKDNRLLFSEKNIEFCSKKGQTSPQNQDNFFCVVDGEFKIFGLFDGHGSNGQITSAFVMGCMLDYFKNSKKFVDLDLMNSHSADEEVIKAIKCCFKYAQDRIRE